MTLEIHLMAGNDLTLALLLFSFIVFQLTALISSLLNRP